ncbi:MAG: glycosyltransferase family 39 protein [Anaerolineae bacterium]|nr:glycosyltransferase family 39 protein [Anaerolineae bacterium]
MTPITAKKQLQKILPWLILALLLILSFWLRSRYLWLRAMTYDEGHWLMFAVLANLGYAPYTVTFVGIPPLALLTIQLGAKLFDVTLAVRYPMMLFSVIGVGSMYLSLRPWQNSFNLLAGLLAALFYSFDLVSFRESSTFMGEGPALAMAVLSFVLWQQYRDNRKLFWLLLSGLAFGLSLALKLFMVFFPAFVGILLLIIALKDGGGLKISALKQVIITGLVWGLGVTIPWGIFFTIYTPQALYREVFLFRLAFREVNLSRGAVLLENSAGVARMMVDRWPLALGAVLGVISGWRKRRFEVFTWLIWLVLAVVPLVWQSPLRPRYSVALLPPLAALSGIGIVYLVRWLFDRLQKKASAWVGYAVVGLTLTVIFVAALSIPVKNLLRPADPYPFPNLNFDVVEYIQQTTLENDCIVTDDQRFAFAAHRLVPPALSETGQGRLATGWLTGDEIVSQIQQHDCPAVVYMVNYFTQFLPDLADKLRELYFLEIVYDEDFTVYTGKKHVRREPAIPLNAQFGQAFVLNGIDLAASPWSSGQKVGLATYWTALTQPDRACKIFVQLRDRQNETIASFDYFPFAVPGDRYQLLPEFDYQYRLTPHIDVQAIPAEEIAAYPAKGMIPTNAWPVGQTIREITTLPLPDLEPGVYDLYLGMYDPATFVRLPLQSLSGSVPTENDVLWLTQIKVIEAE